MGQNEGATVECSVPALKTISGVCGAHNGQTLTSTPTNLCSSGISSTISGNGPWNWSCSGENGGITATCSANLKASTVISNVSGRDYCKYATAGSVLSGDYCSWKKVIFEQGCGGAYGEGGQYCEKSGSGYKTLLLPSIFSDVKVTYFKIDDSGSIIVNGIKVYSSRSGCGRTENPNVDITQYVRAGQNKIEVEINNDCGLSMSGEVGIEFSLNSSTPSTANSIPTTPNTTRVIPTVPTISTVPTTSNISDLNITTDKPMQQMSRDELINLLIKVLTIILTQRMEQ